ncbi:MAG: 50S ribosomal protein L6, partial [Planctomycetales bacterium]
MSRIGKQPVIVPDGVKGSIADRTVALEKGSNKLDFTFRSEIDVAYDESEKKIMVTRKNDNRQSRALHGLTRALIQNMVVGLVQGYEKRLEIHGVGYLAHVNGDILDLRVGFKNEIHLPIPQELNVTCSDPQRVSVKGADKQLVGQFAASVRATRKPEPYNGKGIR